MTTLFQPATPGRTRLLASDCACGQVDFPRRERCPACGADASPIQLAGPARVRTTTAVLAQPPGSLVAAPYRVAVAEFREGVCVIGVLVGDAEVGDQVASYSVSLGDADATFVFAADDPGPNPLRMVAAGDRAPR